MVPVEVVPMELVEEVELQEPPAVLAVEVVVVLVVLSYVAQQYY